MSPAPRENPLLFGHAGAEAAFAQAWASGRVHHAWLITGSPGVGKATLAYRFARRLLSAAADPNDPADPVFRRVARGSHADLMTVERLVDARTRKVRREIAVEQVRQVAGFLHLTAGEGGKRVVLVDGAEDMNRNAANALLKVLEEPPKGAVLLLTSDSPGRLLPTIRSRCRLLRLDALDEAAMAGALRYLLPELDEAERSQLGAMVDGAPGRAVLMAEEGALALAALAREVVASPALPIGRMYDVADSVTRGEAGFETFMGLLQDRVADQVRGAARQGERVVNSRPLAEWGEVWHALGHLHAETERFNLDKRTAVVTGLQLLTKAGHFE